MLCQVVGRSDVETAMSSTDDFYLLMHILVLNFGVVIIPSRIGLLETLDDRLCGILPACIKTRATTVTC